MIKIPVFMSSDDNYAPFVATTMASICKNTNEFIEFYVLDGGISSKNKIKIQNTNKYFKNFSIEFIEVDIDKYFKDLPELEFISKSMYSRFLIPLLKPELEKVIYTDIDAIFVKDIKELFSIDLGENIIGAVGAYREKENALVYSETKERLELSNKHTIFCSGLLVINTKKWNQENLTEKILNLSISMAKKNILNLPDQDILNKFFNDNYKQLDKTFGIIPKCLGLNFDKNEIVEIYKNAAIFHYTGGGIFKPWNNKKIEGARYFWKYVKFTAFKKEINKIYKNFNNRGSLLQKLFSVKNEYKDGIKRKIIRILGFKISFKDRNKYYFAYDEWRNNAGDIFNKDLLEYFGIKYSKVSRYQHADIVAIGSTLGRFLVDKKPKKIEKNIVIILGTGFIEEYNEQYYLTNKLKVLALRGRYSLSQLEKFYKKKLNNIVLGDFGLLISNIYKYSDTEKKYDVGIIPHYLDKQSPFLKNIELKNKKIKIIDIQQTAKDVVKEITQCNCILSSSLHGLIFADSYNIPNKQIVLSNKLHGGNYKFKDYYSAFDLEYMQPIDVRTKIISEEDIDNIIKNYRISKQMVENKQKQLFNVICKNFNIKIKDFGKNNDKA